MFSPACPTRTPGDQCFVPGTFFQGYVSGEEKMKRIEARLACMRFFPRPNTP
jgi:RNA exonuclease 1